MAISNKNKRYQSTDSASLYNLKQNMNTFMEDFSQMDFCNVLKNDYFTMVNAGEFVFWDQSNITVGAYDTTKLTSPVTFASGGYLRQDIRTELTPNTSYTVAIYANASVANTLKFGVYSETVSGQIYNLDDTSELNQTTTFINTTASGTLEKHIIHFRTRSLALEGNVYFKISASGAVSAELHNAMVYNGIIELGKLPKFNDLPAQTDLDAGPLYYATQYNTQGVAVSGCQTLTTDQFNNIVTDDDFVTLTGSETISNKIIEGNSIWNGQTLPVTGGGTGVTTSTGAGSNVLNTSPTVSGSIVAGTTSFDLLTGATTLNIAGSSGNTTIGNNLVVVGDFTVNGTTTTLNTTTLDVEDKNIALALNNTLDSAADGGGITLKGASDKTILYKNSTDSWDFNKTITAGSDSATNGSVILKSIYDSNIISSIGTSQSNGAMYIGYCVSPSLSTANTFLSSYSSSTPRAAMVVDGDFHFYTGTTSTIAIGNPSGMSEKMSLSNDGNLSVIGTVSSNGTELAKVNREFYIGTTPIGLSDGSGHTTSLGVNISGTAALSNGIHLGTSNQCNIAQGFMTVNPDSHLYLNYAGADVAIDALVICNGQGARTIVDAASYSVGGTTAINSSGQALTALQLTTTRTIDGRNFNGTQNVDFTSTGGATTIAIGNSTTTAEYATAIGNSIASERSVAVGRATAIGIRSTSIGTSSQTNGDYSTAIGFGAQTANNSSLALGYMTYASNTGTSVGSSSSATGTYSVSLGFNAQATATNSISIGSTSDATGAYSLSLGYNAQATGIRSTAIGYTTSATQDGSLAIGYNTTVSQTDSIGIGRSVTVTSYNSIGIGYYASATGNNSSAIGASSLASGFCSSAFGVGSKATGYESIAIGHGSEANAISSIAIGKYVVANNNYEIKIGDTDHIVYISDGVTHISDERDKANIENIKLGLNFIEKLRPVNYQWDYRDSYYVEETYNEPIITKDVSGNEITEYKESIKRVSIPKNGSKIRNRKHNGLIAQEVKKVADEIGFDFAGYKDVSFNGGKGDSVGLNYIEFIAPMIKAIQELSEKVKILEAKLESK